LNGAHNQSFSVGRFCLFCSRHGNDKNENGSVMMQARTLIIAIIAFLDGVVSITGHTLYGDHVGLWRDFRYLCPTDFVVDVSDPIDPATVDASDFTVNGIPANNFTFSNSNTTIAFDFTTSPAGQGVNTFHIADGAFNCGGGPVLEFTCRIRYILVRPNPTPWPRPIPP
jgi:hypothetical protein